MRLDQQLAANLIVVLTAVWGFRIKSLELSQRVLRRKPGALLVEHNMPVAGWNLEYPSFLSYRQHVRVANDQVASWFGGMLRLAHHGAWSVLPIVLAGLSLFRLGFSALWVVTALATVGLVAASGFNESLM